MLYSDNLTEYLEELPIGVQEAIEDIKQYFSINDVRVLKYNEFSLVIPVVLKVSIPPAGTVGGVDIRLSEPLLIKISVPGFPAIAPRILSDRKDFPIECLSHLYAVRKNEPPGLCLVRGSVDEWFSDKRMEDFLAVTEQWFFKAAIGKLNDDGDEFDPLRLDLYNGNHVYSYEKMRDIVSDRIPLITGYPAAALFTVVYTNKDEEKDDLTYKTLGPVQFVQLEQTLQAITAMQSRFNNTMKAVPLLSLLVWQPDAMIETEYSTLLPDNYGDLKSYFTKHGIDIHAILSVFIMCNCVSRTGVPIIHAIKRPKKVIGFNGLYEFINFVLSLETSSRTHIDDGARVIYQSHIEPFSSNIAKKLSGEDRNSKTIFLGAGSLGSKIIMHDARSGKLNIGVCDQANFLQHNMVRHSLFDNKVGINKAVAIVMELEAMFESDNSKAFKAYPCRVLDLRIDELSLYNWLVDSTASLNVQNWLVRTELPKKTNIARCELVDEGKLGLLYIEGIGRNPRIDDLVNLTYFRAIDDSSIENWRAADIIKEITTLDIGLGCSSTTTVMPDDLISLHAASFSQLLNKEKDRAIIKGKGLLFRSMVQTLDITSLNSEYELVEPFDIYTCQAGSNWEVRMMDGLKQRLILLCKKHRPKETGGVLIGVCNYKTKTIHVFDIIEEPRDSRGTCTGFIRGIAGLPEGIEDYKQKSGDVIGYIGEWHTHPMDLETLSPRDQDTIKDLIALNNKTPIPTCAVIVTNTKIIPFIYE